MKLLVVFAIVLSVAFSAPTNTITYVDEDGNVITESLDENAVIEPLAVDIKKMHFNLFTGSNKDKPYELVVGDTSKLKSSPFNAAVKTKIIIHGFASSGDADPPQFIKNAYLSTSNVNVIVVDYKDLSTPYTAAVANAKDIGKKIASLVDFLISNGNLKGGDVHVIGHSLGAHIAGFVGQSLSFKLSRATGLDPAGPLFSGSKNDGRLSSDDATYVDCIHTSTALGINTVIGKADFFPNGGSSQPECIDAGLGNTLLGNCDHASSYRYYSESIKNKAKFPAYTCKSESDAKKNKGCSSSGAFMGEDAISKSPAGVYYVAV